MGCGLHSANWPTRSHGDTTTFGDVGRVNCQLGELVVNAVKISTLALLGVHLTVNTQGSSYSLVMISYAQQALMFFFGQPHENWNVGLLPRKYDNPPRRP
jgi:hypothetical protein